MSFGKRIRFFFGVLLIIILLPSKTFAESGDGSGSGGGASTPLYLTSSTPEDGAVNVSTDTNITLYYSHNVADAAIRKNNSAAISMTTADGNSVQIEVSFSDEFSKRQQVLITPVDLQPNTKYIITIDSSFMAKNEYRTGTTQTVTFSTGATTQIVENVTESVESTTTAAQNSIVVLDNSQVTTSSNDENENTGITTTTITADEQTNTSDSLNVDDASESDNIQETSLSQEESTTTVLQESQTERIKPGKVTDTESVDQENTVNQKNNRFLIVLVIFGSIILVLLILFIVIRKRKNGKL